jgi:hypothetical protein
MTSVLTSASAPRDRDAARLDRGVGDGIDHRAQHPHLHVAIVASSRGGQRPANHAKSHAKGD